jgi:hypothetical protein
MDGLVALASTVLPGLQMEIARPHLDSAAEVAAQVRDPAVPERAERGSRRSASAQIAGIE